jgi:hypothetical protein
VGVCSGRRDRIVGDYFGDSALNGQILTFKGKTHLPWEQIKSGVDVAMEDLGKAYQKAAAEISKP